MHNPDPADLVACTAEEIVGAIALSSERAAWLRRRLTTTLHDLGLLPLVGSDWVHVGATCLEFSDLTWRQADYLVRALELLADERPAPPPPTPGPGQLQLPKFRRKGR